jgi:hypothetical protein
VKTIAIQAAITVAIVVIAFRVKATRDFLMAPV